MKVATARGGMSLNALRLSLDGLDGPDAETLRSILDPAHPAELWQVASGECHAMVVDPASDAGARALGARPFGALIIWVLEPGETAWPGTLSLSRPLDERQVRLTLHIAAQIALQPHFQRPFSRDEPPPPAPEPQQFMLTSEPAIPDAEPQAATDVEAAAGGVSDDPGLYGDAEEPITPSLFDAAIEATFGEPEATAFDLHETAAEADALAPIGIDEPLAIDAMASVELDLALDAQAEANAEAHAAGSLADDQRIALVSPAAEAMASSFDTFREMTLTEAMAELTPTSVPPGDWMGHLTRAEAPREAPSPAAVDTPALLELEEEPGGDRFPSEVTFTAYETSEGDQAQEPTSDAGTEEPPPPQREETAHSDPEAGHDVPHAGTIDSLAGLAAAYREQLYREREVLVQIDDLSFHLLPYQGICVSDSNPEHLARYRGRRALEIEIDLLVTEPGERVGQSTSLVHFLWHLGLNAGEGMLLPWIPVDRACRLMRWPPVPNHDETSPVFRMAALLARAPALVPDVVEAAGAPEAEAHDFLNGCSLLGYLEVLAGAPRSARGAPAALPDGPATKPPAPRSLVGRLRQRIGLQQ